MDYENKYKQALSRATFYNNELLTENQRKMLLDIFPELTMSEDERMKDYIKDVIQAAIIPKKENKQKMIAWLEKQGNKIVDCPQNHQDVKYPNGGIVMEDFNGGEGFYKLHLDYLSKKQVEEVEEMVRMWNKESKIANKNIKNCIGECLTVANEQRFKDYSTTLKDCLAWLEKQGKKLDADEVIEWLESTYIKFFPYDDDVYKSIKNIEI